MHSSESPASSNARREVAGLPQLWQFGPT
jgi:hypothetical protein